MSKKIEKLESWFLRYAGEFITNHFNFPETIITASRAVIEPNLTSVKILITVYPETKEQGAIEALKKSASDFREYAKKFYRMKKLPKFEFAIDYGEKSALRIEEILAKEKLKAAKKKK